MLHKSMFHKPLSLFMGLSALLFSLLSVSLTRAVPAAPGDLDPSFAGFGTGGVVTPTGLSNINGLAVQPDGKMVIVGYTGTFNDLAVYRYLANGQLDTTFDGDGKASFPDMFVAFAVAIQSDGQIVVGGTRDNDFQLARLTPTGALDSSFDGDGWVQDIDAELAKLYALLVQPDGKIVACGYAEVGGDDDFGVARYDTYGARDNTFSDDGKVTIPFGEEDLCNAVVQQNDGKLVVVGSKDHLFGLGDDDFAVARLEINGTLDDDNGDGGFDGDGKLTTGFGGNEHAWDVALQPDGKIVVLGDSSTSKMSHMARYLSNGALDGSFDGDGKLTIPTDTLYSLALQADGKMVALGYHQSPDGDSKFAVHRLLPGGAPDTSFDYDGIAWLDFGGYDIGTDLALQPDGRILVAGTKGDGAVMARLWPDGTTFDTGGQQTHGLAFPPAYQPGYREQVHGMALQPDGSFLVAGHAYAPDYAFSDAFVTRFNPDGLLDGAFGVNGSARVAFGIFNVARAVAVQPDGKIVVAGYSAFDTQYAIMDFLVARFNVDGSPDSTFGNNGSYLVNFPADGADGAVALALAPDGKIVVAGTVWTGSTYAWGVARLTDTGQPDPTFGTNGLAVNLSGNNAGANAVVVQPDGKIIIGGSYNNDFFLQRLLEHGSLDASFGIHSGYNVTDLGGTDVINALVQAPNGWVYAAGYRVQNGNADMALAQYTQDGILASCPDPANCDNWPTGTFFVDIGINDYAYALDLRGDNQLVAAGCSNQHFAAVQVPTDGDPIPLSFNTDFVGYPDCAKAVQFTGANQILLAGDQDLYPFSSDWNIALARFETTVDTTLPTPTPGPSPTPGPGPTPTPSPAPGSFQIFLPITRK